MFKRGFVLVCGINGIITENISIKKKIRQINDMLIHRGPDDEGYVFINTGKGNFSVYSGSGSVEPVRSKYPDISSADYVNYDLLISHRRLSIIDLSETGHGPMCDPSGKIWITYNGEIYNYIELRDELTSLGYSFRTKSDTEIIINSYIQWGTDCLNRFNGMWAFAIWDSRVKQLFLSRDRFGVKPLYYTNTPDFFAFSSEIKPLVVLTEKAELNDSLIPFFILHGNRLNNSDTFLKGINLVKPSTFLLFDSGRISTHKYYNIENRNLGEEDDDALARKLDELVTDSIRLRFRSDVPVGTCLSGGFDSSAIVSISTDIKKEGIKTFSAVWSDEQCDESKYIDIVNKKFNCTPKKVEPKAEEFESVFSKLNQYQEIPTEGPGLIPQWYVMSKAKNEVKVLLDGQGGDEVFGGYFSTQSYLLSIIKDRDVKSIINDFNKFSVYLNKNGLHSFSNWLFPKFYGKLLSKFKKENYGILNKNIIKDAELSSLHFDSEPPKIFKNYLNNLSYHFITHFTIPSLLHYEDRSSMAFSIESRVPFLDYRVVEFGLNLKPRHLINKNVRRFLFRKTFEKKLPAEITGRKDKLGYPTPFTQWSRNALKDYIYDTLLGDSANIKIYTDKSRLTENLQQHFDGLKDHSWKIWRLLSLESIIKIYNSLLKNRVLT